MPPAPAAPVEPDSPALATDLEDSFFETRRLRKDGWDSEKMALFCGNLAETGIVTFACRASGMSAQSAYGLRHRNPLFAKAWEAALSMARERLADELLARSLKGGAEQLLKDGCIVAERHTFDNKLAFAMLRRLDHRAELGTTFRKPAAWELPLPAPAVKGQWQDLLDALSEERSDDALALLDPPKVDSEVDDPPFSEVDSDSLDNEPLVPRRVWQVWKTDQWRTDFPPPPEFDGEEKGVWEDKDYSRTLTAQEHHALVAAGRAAPLPEDVTFTQDEAERDAFFASLVTPVAPPSAEADLSSPAPSRGEESALADGGGTNPTKPPKSEPPSAHNRSTCGAR
ncbi:MAG: hypothetical protein LH610_09040 [Sphingomonas bacterium]|nr:hypothetical protein [Sphingomonas bacterium]